MKPLVYVLVGPTAVGKTTFAIYLAHQLKSEIISADSMQIYKGMDIGTAKPQLLEREGIEHHFIDICEPNIEYTVADFQSEALSCLNDIISRNKIPIIVGGSGLYVNSITYRLDFSVVPQDFELRERLNKKTSDELFLLLQNYDKNAAGRIHPNDKKRIIRALEIAFSQHHSDYNFEKYNDDYDFRIIGLYNDREELYQNINSRVDAMMQQGLKEEVKNLYSEYGYIRAFQAIGYKELIMNINGYIKLSDAVELIKKNTRRFAKRQLTWFKRDARIKWLQTPKDDCNREKLCNNILIGNYI